MSLQRYTFIYRYFADKQPKEAGGMASRWTIEFFSVSRDEGSNLYSNPEAVRVGS